jgi:hypothetical protein
MTWGPAPGRPVGRWLGGAALVIALAFPSSALAQRARVALAQPIDPDPVQAEVSRRIRAELEAASFDVVVVPLDPGGDPRAGVELAGGLRPIATVAIVSLQNRPAVDVWVSDRVTGKTLVKRLDVGRRADAELTSSLAIHAVELLRASLLEMRTQSGRREETGAADGTSRLPNEVTEWVNHAILPEPLKPLFERPSVAVAAATLYSSPSMGLSFAPVLRASVGDANGLAGRLALVGPGFGAELRGPQGTASIRQELALAELVYAPSRRWLVPSASAGIGAYHLYLQGDATDPAYRGVSNQIWAFVAEVGLELAARIGSGAAISLDLHGLVTEPAARIAIGESSIATVGRPSLLASFGLLAGF